MNKAIITLVSPNQEVQSYHADTELFMKIWSLLNDNNQPMIDSLDKPILINPITEFESDRNHFVIETGTKPGYVEIIFDTKPDQSIIDELKSSGFRWSIRNKLWYGKADRLPAKYADYIPEYHNIPEPDKTPVTAPDKPESGKVYQLTGKSDDKCISNGDSWQDSEVKPESFNDKLMDLMKTI